MSDDAIAAVDSATVQSSTGRVILDKASLELRRGRITCLVGPSGSGKTTTGLLMLGLLAEGTHLTNGSVHFRGRALDPVRQDEYRSLRGSRMGIVFQDPYASLNPLRRCGPQVEDAIRVHRTNGVAAKPRVLEALNAMGFDDPQRIFDSFPHQLSGGQRQRVLMALATVLEPELLVADEPTASLDKDSELQIIALIQSLARNRGTAVLLISHDKDLVEEVADDVLEIQNGAIHAAKAETRFASENVRLQTRPCGSSPLLEVSSLTKTYSRPTRQISRSDDDVVLRDVSLDMFAGEMIGVFGASGAGKTTLARCIAGLENYQLGRVLLAGSVVRPRGLRPHDGRIQMIYQNPAASLNPRMRISEIIAEALCRAGVAPLNYDTETVTLLEQVGLPSSVGIQFPSVLSGGEKQRVAIARCLARRPLLIFADEPTASLDEQNKQNILKVLRRLADARGIAIALVTHERALANKYCNRTFELMNGRLRQIGSDAVCRGDVVVDARSESNGS